MEIGTSVQLISFNGSTSAPKAGVDPAENYWSLVGATGKVVNVVSPPGVSNTRVLVKFNVELDKLGLHSHNEIADSLWIEQSDLSVNKASVNA